MGKKGNNTKTNDNVILLMKNVAEFGRFSFELEEKREQSLITQSGHMLTALSILSAALLMTLPLLFEYTLIEKERLLSTVGIVFVPIIVSIVLCIITQWRFGYQTMMNAKTLQDRITSDIESYPTQAQYDCQWNDQLSVIQDSIKKKNDIRVHLLSWAIINLLLAILLMVAAWLLFVVMY